MSWAEIWLMIMMGAPLTLGLLLPHWPGIRRFLRKLWLSFRVWLLKWEVILEGPPYTLTEKEKGLIDELEES